MNACPRCGAAVLHSVPDMRYIIWECNSDSFEGRLAFESDPCKLRQIAALCRAGEVTAEKVLAIIEPQQGEPNG